VPHGVGVESDGDLGLLDDLAIHLEASGAHRPQWRVVGQDEPPLVATGCAGSELVALEEDDRCAAPSELVRTGGADDASTDHDDVRHGPSVSAGVQGG
jgi:hypothetical protein